MQNFDQLLRILEVFIVMGGLGLVWKFGRVVQKFESTTGEHSKDITMLKDGVAKIATSLETLARVEERLLGLGTRVGRAEQQIDELRHGEGYVLRGLSPTQPKIGGE